MLVFASFGVQLFAGKLAKCNDPRILERVTTYSYSTIPLNSQSCVLFCKPIKENTFLNKVILDLFLVLDVLWSLVTGRLSRYFPNKCQHFQKPQSKTEARWEETRFLGPKSLVWLVILLLLALILFFYSKCLMHLFCPSLGPTLEILTLTM